MTLERLTSPAGGEGIPGGGGRSRLLPRLTTPGGGSGSATAGLGGVATYMRSSIRRCSSCCSRSSDRLSLSSAARSRSIRPRATLCSAVAACSLLACSTRACSARACSARTCSARGCSAACAGARSSIHETRFLRRSSGLDGRARAVFSSPPAGPGCDACGASGTGGGSSAAASARSLVSDASIHASSSEA